MYYNLFQSTVAYLLKIKQETKVDKLRNIDTLGYDALTNLYFV